MVGGLTAGSLFVGVGGFDLAFQRAGIDVLFQVEKDEKCQTTLQHHFPDTTRYRQMGNAVAVPVFEWVARRLAMYAQQQLAA